MRSFLPLFILLLSALQLDGQTVARFLAVDTLNDVVSVFHSSSTSLSGEENNIFHAYIFQNSDKNFRYSLGNTKIKRYNSDQLLTGSERCDDSIYIRKVLVKKDGGLIYVGRTLQNLHFKGIDTLLPFTIYNHDRSFLIETDRDGNTIGFDAFNTVGSAFLDKEENVLYFTENDEHFNKIRLYKKDLTGRQITLLSTITTQQRNEELEVLVNGDYIYVSGGFLGPEVTVGDSLIQTGFAYNTFVAQFSRSGEFHWLLPVEDITLYRTFLAPAPGEGIYWSSTLGDATKIGSFQMNGPNWGGDFFLARIDANGEVIWVRECPEHRLTDFMLGNSDAIASDPEGNVVLVGANRNGIQWDASTLIKNETNAFLSTILVFDKDGNLSSYYTDHQNVYSMTHSVMFDSGSNFVVSGSFQDAVGFEDDSVAMDGYHNYLVYFSPAVLSTDNRVLSVTGHFTVFPNPSGNGAIQIRKTEPEKAVFQLYDIFGRVLREIVSYDQTVTMDITGLSKGVYWVKMKGGNASKLIII